MQDLLDIVNFGLVTLYHLPLVNLTNLLTKTILGYILGLAQLLYLGIMSENVHLSRRILIFIAHKNVTATC